MTQITVTATTTDKKSLLSAIAVLTLLAGGSTIAATAGAGKAAPKGKGKTKPAEEFEDDGEFVDESEISNYDGGSEDNGADDFDFGDNDGNTQEEEDFSFVEEEEVTAPKTKAKAAPATKGKPEIKLDQLVVAFQALVAKKGGQEHAKKILDKYKVKSIRNLKKEDYEAVLAMATPKKK